MPSGLFGIGLSGLRAAELGLATAGHNIANAATPAFARQRLVQAAAPPLFTGAGYLGQGVRVLDIERTYSQFLARELAAASASAAYHESLRARVETLESLLGEAEAGLVPALEEFGRALTALAADPASRLARSALLGAGQGLVARFTALDARLAALGAGLESEIAARTASANVTARQIAALNREIVAAGASGHAPSDLLDRREALVRELAREIGATTLARADGALDLFTASGQPLVLGAESFALQVAPDPEDRGRAALMLSTPGTAVSLSHNALGGALGAALAFREGALAEARAALGRIAATVASAVNTQHRLGQDLEGRLGGDFFGLQAPAATAHAHNVGDAVLAVGYGDAGAFVASDYRLSYDGSRYTLERLRDGVRFVFSTLPATADGLTIALASGTPAAGDRFLIRPFGQAAGAIALAVSDPARIAAAAPVVASSADSNTGTATIAQPTVLGPAPDPNLLATVTLTFTSASSYDVAGAGTGNPTGLAYVSGGELAFNGWSLRITGAPAAGDVFMVSANSGGAGDNRNATALVRVFNAPLLEGARLTIGAAYGALVGRLGAVGREQEAARAAHQALADQIGREEQALSGVNLDEEAAALVRYQQAYQAAARVIEIAERLFAQLLDLGG